jgi:hypothetical protein
MAGSGNHALPQVHGVAAPQVAPKGGMTSYSRNLPPKSYAATPPVARTWMIITFLDVVIFNILHCQ